MKPLSTFSAAILMLSIGMTLSAQQTITYTEGNTTQTINAETKQFAPNYPEVCLEKKAPPPAPAPVPVIKSDIDSDRDGIADAKDKCPDTPHGYKIDPTGCPVHVTLHVNFAFDSSILPASANGDVETLARVMKENPVATAIIVGHTDHTGTDAYNQKLSERRAHSLGKALQGKGIEAERIKTSGKGEKEPVATNATREGRAQNRRIDVELQ